MSLTSRLARLEASSAVDDGSGEEDVRAELERRLLGPAVSTAVCEVPAWAVEMWPKLFAGVLGEAAS